MNAHAPFPLTDEPNPLHSLDAEQAFLGALLFDNALIDRVEWLRPEHFYDPVHGRIFDTCARLIAGGRLADAVVVKDAMADDPGLKELRGPAAYLAILLESASDSAAAVEYGQMVCDLALRRRFVEACQEGVRAAHEASPDKTSIDAIEALETQLFALAERKTGSRAVSFHDALSQSINMAAAAYQSPGGLSGISTGLKGLDRKLGGLHKSDLVILAGRPSMGKTALATNIAFEAAKDGTAVGFFSLEMSSEQLATRIISDRTGISGSRIRRGEIDAEDFETIRDATLAMQSLPIHIDDTGGLPISALRTRARRWKRQHGIGLIVVDYLQLVTGTKTEGRVQEVSEVTAALKALAKDLDVPVLALSQLSRQVEQRQDKKPQLADLRDSGSIEQDADVVMFVYREAYYKEREKPRPGSTEYVIWHEEFKKVEHEAEVIIGKQRHGPIGEVRLHFDGARTRFSDIETREGMW